MGQVEPQQLGSRYVIYLVALAHPVFCIWDDIVLRSSSNPPSPQVDQTEAGINPFKDVLSGDERLIHEPPSFHPSRTSKAFPYA